MSISSMFKAGKTVLSFEIFPPKADGTLSNLNEIIGDLKELNPDFISVTFGAGGTGVNSATWEIAKSIRDDFGIEPLVHLSCISHSKEEITAILQKLEENNLNNILALRGDSREDRPAKKDFIYASDLISFILKHGDFDISAACYPEGHVESTSQEEDIKHLKFKVDSGANHLISQLFFDNEKFYSFLDRARRIGIDVSIDAGIMPVVNKGQIERMVALSGATLPKKFIKILEKYGDQPESLEQAGIAYAVDQIVDLISQGVDGIHLYTMNNPTVAKRIHSGFAGLLS